MKKKKKTLISARLICKNKGKTIQRDRIRVTVGIPGRQGLEQRRASEESPGQGWILTAPAGFTGDLQRPSQGIKWLSSLKHVLIILAMDCSQIASNCLLHRNSKWTGISCIKQEFEKCRQETKHFLAEVFDKSNELKRLTYSVAAAPDRRLHHMVTMTTRLTNDRSPHNWKCHRLLVHLCTHYWGKNMPISFYFYKLFTTHKVPRHCWEEFKRDLKRSSTSHKHYMKNNVSHLTLLIYLKSTILIS